MIAYARHRIGRGKAAEGPIPAATIIQELDLYELLVEVGASGVEAFRLEAFAEQLSDETAGFVVLDSAGPSAAVGDLRTALHRTFADMSTEQGAAARLLHSMIRRYDPIAAFVGLWRRQQRSLTYFAAGFEQPVIIGADWPHPPEMTVTCQTARGPMKMAFGRSRLAADQRWLLYTKALVDTPDPHSHPFNSVGLIQYAHDDRAMRDDLWVDYLLELSREAHGGSLPNGALLISLDPRAAAAGRAEGARWHGAAAEDQGSSGLP